MIRWQIGLSGFGFLLTGRIPDMIALGTPDLKASRAYFGIINLENRFT